MSKIDLSKPIIVNQKEEISSNEDRLFYMYKNGFGTDTILKIGNSQDQAVIEVHGCILMANSDYFQVNIQKWSNQESDGKKMIELENDSYSIDTMRTFIKTLYKNKNEPTSVEEFIALLELSNFYGCKSILKHQIQLYRMDFSNAVKIFQFARNFGSNSDFAELSKKASNFISTNANQIFNDQNQINALNEDEFCEILSCENLKIKELKLFNALFDWGKFQCEIKKIEPSSENIRDVAKDLIKLIRFPIIPLSDFANKILPTNLLTREEEHKILTYIVSTSHEIEEDLHMDQNEKDSVKETLGLEFNIHRRRFSRNDEY